MPIKTKFDFNKFERYPSHVIQLVGKSHLGGLGKYIQISSTGLVFQLVIFVS